MKYYILIFMAFVLSFNTVEGQKKKTKKEIIMQHLMDAKSAKYEGDTVRAISILKDVLRINPNDTNACGRLGKIYANPYSKYFNKNQAIKYYNMVLDSSRSSEENKRIARANISKLAQYEDTQDNFEQTEVADTVVNVVHHSVQHSSLTTETENVQDRYSKMIEEHKRKQKNKNEEIDNLQNTNDVNSSAESIYEQRLRKHLQKEEDPVKNHEGIKIVPIPPKPTPQPLIGVGINSDSFLMRDTLITYTPPYDILREDIKVLKTAECPKKDGTQYVSALFNHQTGRDAIVFLFDSQGILSIHRDCDLMVGYREIVKNGMQDIEKHVTVTSNTLSNEWSVGIDFNLPDSVLNDPSWSKNVYRMTGVYFNQSASVERKLIEQANKVSQNGKTLKISYTFDLEPINGFLHGKSVVCVEKTDGCKCILAYSESNQLFALATDDYRITTVNTGNTRIIEVDEGLANEANLEYQKLCAFHQQTKGDKRNFTKYVNQLDALAKANQPEALYTSYVAYKHGLWHIKKMQGNMKWALKCQEKMISMQKYLKKNNW